jgi:hypothetical protein
MKKISLKKFVAMRESLLAEKEQLAVRLQEIDAALGAVAEVPAAPAAPAVKKAAPKGKGRRGWRRLQNPMSLREAVIKVTSKTPLTKKEIVAAVEKLGYKFASKDPVNRLGVLLYGKNPKFKNDDGKFSPA